MEQFLIVCPLVFLAGFVDSIAGGGGLISFPAYLLAGVPVHVILGTSKLSAFPGAIVAAARFAKSGLVQWKLALPCGLIAALGAFAGARIALGVDEAVIRSLMVVVLPVVAFYVLRSKPDPGEEEKHSDFDTTDHNSSNGSPGHGGDTFPAISYLPGREADAEVCTVSWESAPGGSIRTARHLLSEGCEYPHRKPRYPGVDRDIAGNHAACVEASDASLYCGWYSVLYAAGAGGFLIRCRL